MGKHRIPVRAKMPGTHHREIQVEVEASGIVLDLKRAILAAAPELGALNDFRLSQRNMDLYDQGTLLYYRIVDATTVDIIKKRGSGKPTVAASAGGATAAPGASTGSMDPSGSARNATSASPASATASEVRSGSRTGTRAAQPPSAAPPRPTPGSRPSSAPQGSRSSGGTASGGVSAAPPPVSASASTNSYRPASASYPPVGPLGYAVGGSTSSSTYPPPPPSAAVAPRWDSLLPGSDASRDDEDDEALVRRLEAGVLALQRDVGQAYVTPTATSLAKAGMGGDSQRVLQLEERCRVAEQRYHDAAARIAELETTVRRYQHLLRKVQLATA